MYKIIPDDPKDQEIADQMSALLNHARHTSLKVTTQTLIEGMTKAYEECPDSYNKTFEEVAEWAGRHVLLKEAEVDAD